MSGRPPAIRRCPQLRPPPVFLLFISSKRSPVTAVRGVDCVDNRGLRCSGDGWGCGQVPRVTGGQLGPPVDNFWAAPFGPQIGRVVHIPIPRCGLVRPQALHRVKVAQVSPMWVTVDNFSGIRGRSGTSARQKSSSAGGCGRAVDGERARCPVTEITMPDAGRGAFLRGRRAGPRGVRERFGRRGPGIGPRAALLDLAD